MITVFTPTYNRAHLLPRLFASLCVQDNHDFEWLVIDDGSNDGTEALFDEWRKKSLPFGLHYVKVHNGGKDRAINKALELANGEYFFIVDSDDALASNALSFVEQSFKTLPEDDETFIGISGLRVRFDGGFLHVPPTINPSVGFVDCNNLERPMYNLQDDMAEVFYTHKLRQYEFPVWPGEKFTPEAVVWDKIALDGYKLRWFDTPIYYCEYQENGLSDSTWSLLKNNPMGYAMLFNTQLMYKKNGRMNLALQFISCCCLAGEYGYVRKCNSSWAWVLFPLGWVLSLRRKMQLKRYVE